MKYSDVAIRSLACCTILVLLVAAGCGSGTSGPQRAAVPLGDNADFKATAGKESSKGFAVNFSSNGVPLTAGDVLLQAAYISFVSSNGAVEDCAGECGTSGLPAENCDDICSNGHLLVLVAMGTQAEAENRCEGADAYGPFIVTLGADGKATAVSPASAALLPHTIEAFHVGTVGVCVGVVSPHTGTVTIERFAIDAVP